MRPDWPAGHPGLDRIIALMIAGQSRSTGKPLLMFARGSGLHIYRLVAELDGDVLATVREGNPANRAPRCVLYPYNTDADRYVYALLESSDDGGARAYAAVKGSLGGGPPTVELREETLDPGGPAYWAAAPGLVRLYGKLNLFDWDAPDAATFLGPTDEGAPGMLLSQGDAIFWSSGYVAEMKHKVWTPDGGSRDFLGTGANLNFGAADLGTDGTSMVWVEGTGRASPSDVFATVTAKTAPHTTDSSQIVPRALRSDLSGYGFSTSPFKVGCGHAARHTNIIRDSGSTTGIQVIRLADGYDAHLVNELGAMWLWTYPLAVTCDELLVAGYDSSGYNAVRVPLTSLGPWRAP